MECTGNGWRRATLVRGHVLLEILVSSGRKGVKEKQALRGLPTEECTPFNCHSSVFSDNEARRILTHASKREDNEVDGLAATEK